MRRRTAVVKFSPVTARRTDLTTYVVRRISNGIDGTVINVYSEGIAARWAATVRTVEVTW